MTTDLPAHDSRMTPDFNYTLEHSIGGDCRLHATETRPRVCEPSGKARLRSKMSHDHLDRIFWKATLCIVNPIFKNKLNGFFQALLGFFYRLALTISTGDLGTNRPKTAFGSRLNNRC
ncbi:MAG: hypothetical protein RL077_993 [Verrucomicrobiota bacterium]